MSQQQSFGLSGDLPPEIPLEFITDEGTSVPQANQLYVLGATSSRGNVNGIFTSSGEPSDPYILYVNLTNRVTGEGVSTNGDTINLFTFTLDNSPRTYRFDILITGIDLVTNDGVGYTMLASAKTDGTNASVVATPFLDNDEDPSLVAASVNFIASGNDVILTATGVAGQFIAYRALANFVMT